jgi:hypothetical protein
MLKLCIGCLDLLLHLLSYHFFADLQDMLLELPFDLVKVVVEATVETEHQLQGLHWRTTLYIKLVIA